MAIDRVRRMSRGYLGMGFFGRGSGCLVVCAAAKTSVIPPIRVSMLRQLQSVGSIRDIEGDNDEVVGRLGACDAQIGTHTPKANFPHINHASIARSQWDSAFTQNRGCWTSVGVCTQVCLQQIHAGDIHC